VTLTPHPLLVPRSKIEQSYTFTLPKGQMKPTYWHCKVPSIGLSPLACKSQFTQYAMRCGSTAVRAFVLFISTCGSKQNFSKLLTHINNLPCVPWFIKRKLYNPCNVLLEISLIKKTPNRNTIQAWDKQFLQAGCLCTWKSIGIWRVSNNTVEQVCAA